MGENACSHSRVFYPFPSLPVQHRTIHSCTSVLMSDGQQKIAPAFGSLSLSGWKGCTLARWSTTESAWPFYLSAIQDLLRSWQVRGAGLFAATTPPSAGRGRRQLLPACVPPEALSFKETNSPQKRGLVLRLFCRYSSDAGDQKSRNPNQRSKSRTHTPPAPSPKSGNSQQQPEHATSSLQNSITRPHTGSTAQLC